MNRLRGHLNRWRRRLADLLLHRVVFGELSQGRWLPHTRIAPSTCIEHAERLVLADHVFIGAFNFIEASGGITIGEGTQVTHHVSIVTHSSHRSMRLLAKAYVTWPAGQPRPGWVAGPVAIGAWCFIGPHSLLEPGTTLGDGCIVRAGSVLRGDYPPHSVIAGNPAVVVVDARQGDQRWLDAEPALRRHYEAWAVACGPGAGPAAGQRPVSFGRHKQSAGTVCVRPQFPSRPAIPSGAEPGHGQSGGLTAPGEEQGQEALRGLQGRPTSPSDEGPA